MTPRMRRRARRPGTGANATSAFSAMCSALVVSVSTQVTAGFARMYCSENWAQLAHSNSAAQSGSGTLAARIDGYDADAGRVCGSVDAMAQSGGSLKGTFIAEVFCE